MRAVVSPVLTVLQYSPPPSPTYHCVKCRAWDGCVQALSEMYLSFFLFLPPSDALGQNLFESIKNEPFSIPEDDGNDLTHTFFNPSREGWLLKLGKGQASSGSSEFPALVPPITNLPQKPTQHPKTQHLHCPSTAAVG